MRSKGRRETKSVEGMGVVAVCQACNPYNEEQRHQKQDIKHHYQQEWKAWNRRDVQDGDATEQK